MNDDKLMIHLGLVPFKFQNTASAPAVVLSLDKLVPPPDAKATAEIGESRSAKRGPVSIAWLPETDGLGGLKDKEFSKELEESVALAYGNLCAWHDANQ